MPINYWACKFAVLKQSWFSIKSAQSSHSNMTSIGPITPNIHALHIWTPRHITSHLTQRWFKAPGKVFSRTHFCDHKLIRNWHMDGVVSLQDHENKLTLMQFCDPKALFTTNLHYHLIVRSHLPSHSATCHRLHVYLMWLINITPSLNKDPPHHISYPHGSSMSPFLLALFGPN